MSEKCDESSPSTPGVVLSIGQCDFDNGQLRDFIRSLDPTLKMHAGNDFHETLALLAYSLGHVRLILVNRVLDIDGSSGIELIRSLRAYADHFGNIPVMLVSDREAAQAQAIAEGALPGFGKSALRSAQTRDRVRQAIESVG